MCKARIAQLLQNAMNRSFLFLFCVQVSWLGCDSVRPPITLVVEGPQSTELSPIRHGLPYYLQDQN